MDDVKKDLFFYKVKNDRRWYMENFLKIRSKDGRLIPFKLNTAQQILEKEIEKCEEKNIPKRFIILKARQMGFSTFTEGLIFRETSTQPFINSLIIAHEDKATQNLFNMSKLFYEELPNEIRPMKKYSNEKALSFENATNNDVEKQANPGLRSKITVATAGAGEAGRSATIHNLHISELAFFPNPETTMLGLLQSVPDTPNSLIVIESTANGVGNYFHRLWNQSVRGENDFIPLFFPWFTEPSYSKGFASEMEKEQFANEINATTKDDGGRDIHSEEYHLMKDHNLTLEQMHWRKYTIQNKCNNDLDQFKQEYPSTPEEAFIASGRPKFDTNVLKKYEKQTKGGKRGYLREKGRGVEFVPDDKGYIEIWEEPIPGVNYSIGADVAEGLSHGDYSVGLVGNEDFKVVAMWHGHIDPDLFADELVKLARFYNDAYLGVENNNHGLTTLRKIQDLEYWNIYFQKTYDRLTDKMTSKIGWHTNRKTKPMMINKLSEFLREMHLDIKSDLIVQEAMTYVINDNGTTDAQDGCHDDTIMALAILLQLLLEGRGENYEPEVPDERRAREIIDPLFEEGEVEFSE